jgi:hypothetical protein
MGATRQDFTYLREFVSNFATPDKLLTVPVEPSACHYACEELSGLWRKVLWQSLEIFRQLLNYRHCSIIFLYNPSPTKIRLGHGHGGT